MDKYSLRGEQKSRTEPRRNLNYSPITRISTCGKKWEALSVYILGHLQRDGRRYTWNTLRFCYL